MRMSTLPIKNDHCYALLSPEGNANDKQSGVTGFFLRDTRHLANYGWDFAGFSLVHVQNESDGFTQHWSLFENHEQKLLIIRKLTLKPDGMKDVLKIINPTRENRSFTPKLSLDADFVDVFELRGHKRGIDKNKVLKTQLGDSDVYTYEAQDGVISTTTVSVSGRSTGERLFVSAKSELEFVVSAHFSSSLDSAQTSLKKLEWASETLQKLDNSRHQEIFDQAKRDIDCLLLSTDDGTTIAAGIPNFVVVFGRDSLITAWLLLRAAPDLAKGVLKFLAYHQGQENNAFRDEQPGKIFHEFREGELSRLNDLPFAPYFGTADATPLFIKLLAAYTRQTGDTELVKQLEPNWRAAMKWIENSINDQGWITYLGSTDGKGLTVKTWKDSEDSMSHSDGHLAKGALAVVEAQGYAAEAFLDAVYLNDILQGDEHDSLSWKTRGADLSAKIDSYFWLPEKSIYALAIEEDGKRLEVATSDPSHLLWSGIVVKNKVPTLVDRLFKADLWSGWGLRTLSSEEVRYNALSYHNGSVWPHDTAIFAAGLVRYDLKDGFERVKIALTELALSQPDLRLPELVGGYDRGGSIPPLPYIESCRPQAWAAAALIYVLFPH